MAWHSKNKSLARLQHSETFPQEKRKAAIRGAIKFKAARKWAFHEESEATTPQRYNNKVALE
jgi:hypothetical protein